MKFLLLIFGLLLMPTLMAQPAENLENWPLQLKLPEEIGELWGDARSLRSLQSNAPDILLWVPPDAERIRAVMLIANNTDSVLIGEHRTVREMAARQGMAILYLKHFAGSAIESRDPPELADRSFEIVMELAAKETGIDDFHQAPWITLGKSSRGRFPFRTTWWFPERVIASISYHGETPTWPMANWSKVGENADASESVMHLNIQGLREWDGTWYRHVRPALLNYNRETDWLAHQMVIYGVDHGYYMDYFLYPNHGARLEKDHNFTRVTEVWDYIAHFMDAAITLRVPAGPPPDEGPVTLNKVSRESGYLIHPRAPEELLGSKWFALRQNEAGRFQTIPWPDEVTPVFDAEQGVLPVEDLVRAAHEVPEEERGNYMWVPTRKLLELWLGHHNLYNRRAAVLESLAQEE
ncbi:MAG: hypothetical protein JJU29_04165 [Verrucomicrobia bacterium]|nr:hypothetical protein [Verrucomicrobiota bacterium]MCH8511741.1 hypothetical protein [Kiritimatiellia bacterium]